MKARYDWIAVIAAAGLAIGLRLQHFLVAGDVAGWNGAVLIYGNIAANLIHGHGYVSTAQLSLIYRAGRATVILPAAQMWPLAMGPHVPPNAYYMPGYPLFMAVIWGIAGTLSYSSVQIVTLIVDGLTMTLGPWLMLRSLGRTWAGVVAALLCGLAAPLIDLSTRVMPNALGADLVLWGLVAAIVLRNRLVLAMSLAGMCFGAALWLQGDMIIAAPLVTVAVVAAAPTSWRNRARGTVVLLSVVGLWDAALSVFLSRVYGGFHLTRPGLGALLGQGLEEYEPHPAHAFNGLEYSQHILLRHHHFTWGSWAGDSLLLHQAVQTIAHAPSWYMDIVLHRAASVASLAILDPTYPWPMLAILGIAGVWSLRGEPYVLIILMCAWLGRVVPFSFIHVEGRYIALLYPLDMILVTCGAAALYSTVQQFIAARRARRGLSAVAVPAD